MPFAQSRFVRSKDEWYVGKHWQRRANGLVEQYLLGRVRQMIGAANDVRDLHIHVVADHAQVICWSAIGAQKYKILKFGVGKFHLAIDRIFEDGSAFFRDGEPNGSLLSSGT